MWFHFTYKDIDVVLDPETIKDIREQIGQQLKEIPFYALLQTVKAAGLSPRNLVALFRKGKEVKDGS